MKEVVKMFKNGVSLVLFHFLLYWYWCCFCLGYIWCCMFTTDSECQCSLSLPLLCQSHTRLKCIFSQCSVTSSPCEHVILMAAVCAGEVSRSPPRRRLPPGHTSALFKQILGYFPFSVSGPHLCHPVDYYRHSFCLVPRFVQIYEKHAWSNACVY